jgi:hypothetical protein
MSAAATTAFAQGLRPGNTRTNKPRWGVTGTLKRGNFKNPNRANTFAGEKNGAAVPVKQNATPSTWTNPATAEQKRRAKAFFTALEANINATAAHKAWRAANPTAAVGNNGEMGQRVWRALAGPSKKLKASNKQNGSARRTRRRRN